MFTLGAFAGTPSVTMELTAPAPGPSLDGIYINPYTALIGAAGQTAAPIGGVSTAVLCDDWTTDVYPSTPPWQATVTDLSQLYGETAPSDVVKFDNADSPTITNATAAQQQNDYTVAGWLAIEVEQAQQANNTTVEGQLSYALWMLFDPTDPATYLNSVGAGGDLSAAETDLANAKAYVSNDGLNAGNFDALTGYDLTIYTSVPKSYAQEYLSLTPVAAPEASSVVVLAADLMGVFGLIFLLRRRAARATK
jgi:hypothetical protein